MLKVLMRLFGLAVLIMLQVGNPSQLDRTPLILHRFIQNLRTFLDHYVARTQKTVHVLLSVSIKLFATCSHVTCNALRWETYIVRSLLMENHI